MSLPPPQQPHIQPVAEPAHGEDAASDSHDLNNVRSGFSQ